MTEQHAHAPADSTLVYTDYTSLTELFVEFPALIVGEVSTFAAHVTRLGDYGPLTSGRLDVLREAETGRLYIVDVNKTDTGPPVVLNWRDRMMATQLLAEALVAVIGSGLV